MNAIPAHLSASGPATVPRQRQHVYVPSWRVLEARPLMVYCVPYAGGTIAIYRQLAHHLARHGLGCAVAVLPGRDGAPMADLNLISLAWGLAAALPGGKRVLFGYSLGGLIAYEIARHLDLPRQRLVIAACSAPEDHARRDLWTSGEIITTIEDYAATPPELLRDPGFRRLLIDRLRFDFGLIDRYRPQPRPPLAAMAMLLAGADDTSTSGKAGLWPGHFQTPPQHREFAGDHFFIHQHAAAVAAAVHELTQLQPVTTIQHARSSLRRSAVPEFLPI